MDQGTTGVGVSGEPAESESPEDTADRLAHETDAIREKLSGLVSELDHRRQGVRWRLVKPLAVVAGVGLIVAGAAFWWRTRATRRLGSRLVLARRS